MAALPAWKVSLQGARRLCVTGTAKPASDWIVKIGDERQMKNGAAILHRSILVLLEA